MSETQSYKTVTLTQGELLQIAFALDVRLIQLEANSQRARSEMECRYIDACRSVLEKVEAAL